MIIIIIINNGSRTEWSPVRSVFIGVIRKIKTRVYGKRQTAEGNT